MHVKPLLTGHFAFQITKFGTKHYLQRCSLFFTGFILSSRNNKYHHLCIRLYNVRLTGSTIHSGLLSVYYGLFTHAIPVTIAKAVTTDYIVGSGGKFFPCFNQGESFLERRSLPVLFSFVRFDSLLELHLWIDLLFLWNMLLNLKRKCPGWSCFRIRCENLRDCSHRTKAIGRWIFFISVGVNSPLD